METEGVTMLDEKDFPNVIKVCQQEGHCLCVKRIGDCPSDKKMNWHTFPGWTNVVARLEDDDGTMQAVVIEEGTEAERVKGEGTTENTRSGGKVRSDGKVTAKKC